MDRNAQFKDGRRNGIKWAVAWLHARADEMNDPNAKAILNTAAFNMGTDAKINGSELTQATARAREEVNNNNNVWKTIV